MKKILSVRFFLFLISIGFVTSACDNSVELIDEETGLYSIYGALDMNKEINFIRIKDLNVPIENLADQPLNVDVVLDNLTNGISEVLRDSVVIFDGVPTHNFYTTMEIPPRAEFRITVTGEDGRATSAMATAPDLVEVHVQPEKPGCRTEMEVEISSIELGNVSSHIAVDYDGMEWRWGGYAREFDESITHTFQPQVLLDEIWKDSELESTDCYEICYEDPRPQCYQLDSDFWRVKYIHYGPDFDEGELPEDLRVPGGIGEFGIIRTEVVSFQIDSSRIIPPRPLPSTYCPTGCPPL